MKASEEFACSDGLLLPPSRAAPGQFGDAESFAQSVSRTNRGVLEIGIGSGMNLPFYTALATEILGLEPSPKLLGMASSKSRRDRATLIEGSAESIPLDRASVDTVLVTWTLCSIPDLDRALSEMHRVLKSDGQLLLVEHGLAPDEKVRTWQHRLTPLWKRLAGGCHLDRPIADLVEGAGFRMKHFRLATWQGRRR